MPDLSLMIVNELTCFTRDSHEAFILMINDAVVSCFKLFLAVTSKSTGKLCMTSHLFITTTEKFLLFCKSLN